MKQVKDLTNKASDLVEKVKTHCAILDVETPLYPDQRGHVSGLIQSHSDILKEIARLRVAIQRTNLATNVTIELGGVAVTKSIAEWIVRRRDLAGLELSMWSGQTDRGLREGSVPSSTPGGAPREVRILRFYDPVLRDQKINLFRSEPTTIDSTLEVTNAVTDLIE